MNKKAPQGVFLFRYRLENVSFKQNTTDKPVYQLTGTRFITRPCDTFIS